MVPHTCYVVISTNRSGGYIEKVWMQYKIFLIPSTRRQFVLQINEVLVSIFVQRENHQSNFCLFDP
jgi:hypothetical protein